MGETDRQTDRQGGKEWAQKRFISISMDGPEGTGTRDPTIRRRPRAHDRRVERGHRGSEG
jgi:hypothetical protein